VKHQIEEPFRLANAGLIDRSDSLTFTFDGRKMVGYAGDTLASALLAAGVSLVGRSFKYHRPRGILTAGPEEPNALVELGAGARCEPNTKATTVELYDGLVAASQNRWPTLEWDVLALNSLLGPLIPAGFYYKTFMWPPAFWERLYEPLIRRAAGLGRASSLPDPDQYDQAFAFCDILVVGSGPSGLAAAVAAARSGARVILCEEDFVFGGRLGGDRREIAGMPGHLWARSMIEQLAEFPEVRLMSRTAVFGVYDAGTFGAIERIADRAAAPAMHQSRQRLWRIVARRAVLAAGAIERGIVFGGNDRPGVMMASALRTYANRFAVSAGRRVAIFTNNDDGWHGAIDLAATGVEVVAIIDSRPDLPSELAPLMNRARLFAGSVVCETRGRRRLRAIAVRSSLGTEAIEVDALGVSGGWNPNIGLSCHHGSRPAWNERIAAFVPGPLPDGMTAIGSANGTMTLAQCLAEGAGAGSRLAEELGFAVSTWQLPKADDESFDLAPLWHIGGATKAFVDFQNDVTADDVALAAREGFRSVEHLKRYTTLGMASEQGKTSNLNGLAIMANLTGRSIVETGTTRLRPPHVPVAIGAFAGHHRGRQFRPTRLTPSHGWAQAQGAVFVETGPWLRAQYFPRASDRDWLASVSREVRAVRSAVGFCDVSTLGKIDIQGADAGTFLDRVYINMFSTLAVGRARYGLMLREDGVAFDDGTSSRLAEDRFFMTTTTANAGRVFQHLQFCHQVLWPELDLQFGSVTDEWAQFSVAGPRARDVLAPLVDAPFDISNAGFPYMAAAELTVCGGIRARLYRLSFSGELAFEIGVPARYGDALAQMLMELGAPFGIVPYGTEALGVMRIEKGHVAGNEIDGRTTARDLGLHRMMSTKKEFIGRVMAGRAALLDDNRPALVGFKPVDRRERLRAGAHVLPLGAAQTAANDQGVVTSAAFSPSLDHWIALGLLVRGRERVGERARAADPVRNSVVEVEVCAPCFVDPKGARLHA
jgi:sarcosine oxidase subunit alpha